MSIKAYTFVLILTVNGDTFKKKNEKVEQFLNDTEKYELEKLFHVEIKMLKGEWSWKNFRKCEVFTRFLSSQCRIVNVLCFSIFSLLSEKPCTEGSKVINFKLYFVEREKNYVLVLHSFIWICYLLHTRKIIYKWRVHFEKDCWQTYFFLVDTHFWERIDKI